MAIYKSGHAEILKAIMAENSFEYPLTVDNTEITKLTIDASNKALGTATLEGVYDSGMRGFTTVKYHRVDVSKLVADIDTTVSIVSDVATKVSHVLSAIETYLGIALKPEDIVDEDLVVAPSTEAAVYTGNVVIVDNHPLFYGSFKFTVTGIALDINTLITTRELVCLVDNSPHNSGKLNPYAVTYGIDYTSIYNELLAFPGTTDKEYELNIYQSADLAAALNKADGHPWVSTSSRNVRFNLYGAKVRRFCKTSEFNLPIGINTDYSNIMLLRPHGMWCGEFDSDSLWGFFIHFDDLGGL